jgi:polyisoprenoid-binding protein YceI
MPRRLKVALLAGVVALLGAFAVVYLVLFPTSSPKRFAVSEPAATAAGTPASGAGSWTVAAGSQAGYRVREKLAFLPAKSDAVGRTRAITGTAEATGTSVTKASFKIFVNKLISDDSRRDQRIRAIGLESDRFPAATFVLSKPFTLSRRTKATGVFTIHGVSKTETVPLQVRLSGSTLQAVGSLTFPWSEFGMTAPSVAGFVNVENTATMEFDLHLKRA